MDESGQKHLSFLFFTFILRDSIGNWKMDISEMETNEINRESKTIQVLFGSHIGNVMDN